MSKDNKTWADVGWAITQDPIAVLILAGITFFAIYTAGSVLYKMAENWHAPNRKMGPPVKQLPVDTGSDTGGSSSLLRRGYAGRVTGTEPWPYCFIDRSYDTEVSLFDRLLIEIASRRDVNRHRLHEHH